MTTTVIVCAFRRPDLVPHVLRRLSRQLVRPQQIIYAEDDHNPAMAEAVAATALRLRLPVLHVRQPNRGPRKPAIVNRAAGHATGARLLLLDHDCLPGRCWVAAHRWFGRSDNLVQGWRVHVARAAVPAFLDRRWPLVSALLRRELYSRHRLLPSLRTFPRAPARYELHGCNLAVNRADFLAVGGYDELFNGWGYEDVDLIVRLGNLGRRFRVAGGPATVCHLDHPTQERREQGERRELCQQRRAAGTIAAERGLADSAALAHPTVVNPYCSRVDYAT